MANIKDKYGEPRKHWKCGCGGHSVFAGNKRNKRRVLNLRDIGYWWCPPTIEVKGRWHRLRQIDITKEPCPPDDNLLRYGQIEHSMRKRSHYRRARFVVQQELEQLGEAWQKLMSQQMAV